MIFNRFGLPLGTLYSRVRTNKSFTLEYVLKLLLLLIFMAAKVFCIYLFWWLLRFSAFTYFGGC